MLEVADILTWSRPSDTPAKWRTRYEDLLESRVLSKAGLIDQDHCILDSLSLLPRERQGSFLRSPHVASRLLEGDQGEGFDAAPIAKALLAELAAVGIVSELSEPVWTVNGDRKLDPVIREGWAASNFGILDSHIVVDGSGPTDFSCEATGNLTLASEIERVTVERKIHEAASAISATSDLAFKFWTDCVDVVAIRKAVNPSLRFISNTCARQARLSLLINGHFNTVGLPLVADALIRESVHSLLFMYEEIEKPFVTPQFSHNAGLIKSPWSGAELRLISFVHACVVWYGLYWFWIAASRTGAFPAGIADREIETAGAGFRRRPFSLHLAEYHEFLSPEILDLLREIEIRMYNL